MTENPPNTGDDNPEQGIQDPLEPYAYEAMAIVAIAALEEILAGWEKEYPGIRAEDVDIALARFREAIRRRDIYDNPDSESKE